MKQTSPEGGALILGNSRGKSPETPGSPRPPEGAVEAEGGVREELLRKDLEEPTYWRKRRMKGEKKKKKRRQWDLREGRRRSS